MKVIIAGGRDFTDYKLTRETLDKLFRDLDPAEIEIVSGMAKGADTMGLAYAAERCLSHVEFPADWGKYGKSAGYKRNKLMAEYADALVAFWDGESKGTRHMIDLAKANNLNVRVKRYEVQK